MISPNYLPLVGGTQVAVHNIAKHLMAAGHDVVIVTRRCSGDESLDCYDGVKLRSFREFGSRLSFIYTNLVLYSFLKKHLADTDIIHQFHLLRFGLPVTQYGKHRKKPVITTLMGTDTFDPEYPATRIFSPYLSHIMNSSSAVTSPSLDLARYAQKQGCGKEIHIVPHGIDYARFGLKEQQSAGLRKQLLHNRDHTKIILSVGRLHSIKRADVLIRAMSILVHNHGITKALLVMVGDGPEEANLKRLATELNLLDFIDFRGHISQDNLPTYYHCCDIFAFHSTYETFGIVLAEAMACAKPVVSNLAGAIPEVVDDTITGHLVPPNDPGQFAEKLKALLEDEASARRMGEMGYQKAVQHYDWQTICRQYIQLYSSLKSGS